MLCSNPLVVLLVALGACSSAVATSHAADPTFAHELDRLTKARQAALSEGSQRKAGEASEALGDLYLAHGKSASTAGTHYKDAAGSYTLAARDTRLESNRNTQYNAGLRTWAKARSAFLAAHAQSRSALDARRADEAQRSWEALKAEMDRASVPVDPPLAEPPPLPEQDAPAPAVDPLSPVPWAGGGATIALDLAAPPTAAASGSLT